LPPSVPPRRLEISLVFGIVYLLQRSSKAGRAAPSKVRVTVDVGAVRSGIT
jgi:hypothetical protein